MTGTRGVHFLLAIYPLFLLVNLTLSCLPGEYQMNNFCCPKCDKGSFVKAHCTSESSSSVCVICADNLYIDLPNGLTECFRCKECDPGTPQTDAVCEECPPRHFSNGSNSDECLPWKKCSEMGMVLYKEGTSITDSICKEKRSRILIGVAFLPPVVVVILALKTINSSLKEEPPSQIRSKIPGKEAQHQQTIYTMDETRWNPLKSKGSAGRRCRQSCNGSGEHR
ncbi:tumor necrosis factor receptor superfamily member 14 isoform X3 [Rhinoderma darwinii]|uniref:tumor necrosis factor receptor superfamily member 14 isoform X3 n=1 Tax=Rhinoderma darwinii TaxID=43563 RepID=UPI003F67A40F